MIEPEIVLLRLRVSRTTERRADLELRDPDRGERDVAIFPDEDSVHPPAKDPVRYARRPHFDLPFDERPQFGRRRGWVLGY
jgi:hypothetical protein